MSHHVCLCRNRTEQHQWSIMYASPKTILSVFLVVRVNYINDSPCLPLLQPYSFINDPQCPLLPKPYTDICFSCYHIDLYQWSIMSAFPKVIWRYPNNAQSFSWNHQWSSTSASPTIIIVAMIPMIPMTPCTYIFCCHIKVLVQRHKFLWFPAATAFLMCVTRSQWNRTGSV